MSRRPPRETDGAPRRARTPIRLPKAPTTAASPDLPAEAVAPPPLAPPGERMVTLAAIAGAHGLAGECRLKLFTDDLAAYPTLKAGDRTLELASLRAGGNGGIARFKGVDDRNAAEALRGTALQVPRSALPPLGEGEYYHMDLIGLPAVSTAGEALGAVVSVENFGAGDVIEIARPDGRLFMVPMRPEAVPAWDADSLQVDPAFVTD